MKRSEGFVLKSVGGQDFLVPVGAQVHERNALITLNATGRRIWELLAEERSLDAVVSDFVEHFDVDADTARADIQVFLAELEGLPSAAGVAAPPAEYGAVVGQMLKHAATTRQPAHGTFELTQRCNLACRMCYVRHAAGDLHEAAKELPASAWLELTRQAVDSGMAFVLVTGGEVLVRRDFFDIYEPLSRMGLVISLFTNGTLVTKDIAARLAEAPPNRTEITLYGATAATSEAVTGRPGSYAACCAGIEALLACRVPLALKTTITRQNVGELEAMREMAHNWGLPFSASWLLAGRPDRTTSDVDDCRLSPAECSALEATDGASVHELDEAAIREAAGVNGTYYPGRFTCHAGKASFVVGPAGEMNACVLLRQPAARPMEIGFAEAWKQTQQYVDSAPTTASECSACGRRTWCPRCPAWSLMETGTLTEPVPYLCEIARERKGRFGR